MILVLIGAFHEKEHCRLFDSLAGRCHGNQHVARNSRQLQEREGSRHHIQGPDSQPGKRIDNIQSFHGRHIQRTDIMGIVRRNKRCRRLLHELQKDTPRLRHVQSRRKACHIRGLQGRNERADGPSHRPPRIHENRIHQGTCRPHIREGEVRGIS